MTNASQPPNSIIIMWTLFEGKNRAVQVDLNQTNYKDRSLNLDRLTLVLKEEFNELQNVLLKNFPSMTTIHSPLRSGTLLTEIVTTNMSPLVVRYTFSNATIWAYNFKPVVT
ncbi:5617_t:CDS:2 [Cetraspora pellucida]|uniref:5617_t:CDS:1 n=1 Tax=Cetraspora pellucida TaxID=1433469 RepID=A0A9N9GZK5_9GLOM|nr:5617_t:CDS:2 [Cetraspora pellucida]